MIGLQRLSGERRVAKILFSLAWFSVKFSVLNIRTWCSGIALHGVRKWLSAWLYRGGPALWISYVVLQMLTNLIFDRGTRHALGPSVLSGKGRGFAAGSRDNRIGCRKPA
jgi:hypothetical protein